VNNDEIGNSGGRRRWAEVLQEPLHLTLAEHSVSIKPFIQQLHI
jgi:hypothetical protein